MSFADQTVNGIPVTSRDGQHFIFFCMTGEPFSHNVRMVEQVEVGRNAMHTWFHMQVSKEEDLSRNLMLVVEKQHDTATDYPFLDKPKDTEADYCFCKSTEGQYTMEKTGITWRRTDLKPFSFVTKLRELTSGEKLLQFRHCVDEQLLEVIVDFKFTVIQDAPDKVPEHLTRKLVDKLVENGVYEASSTLREFGCNSLKDLESLPAEDIVNLPLPELTKRKLLMLAGCRSCDCGFLLKRARVGDGRAREGDGRAREGDGRAREGDGRAREGDGRAREGDG
jgi:hypothetical protein